MSGRSDLVVIDQTGALCSVGLGVRQVYASVKAGIGRVALSSVHDRSVEPIRMSLVPDDVLDPLPPEVESQSLTPRYRRMIRLASPALREAAAGLPEGQSPLPVFLGLPEQHQGSTPHHGTPDRTPIDGPALIAAIAGSARVTVDAKRSQVFPRGRAAALLALDAGIRHLMEGGATSVLVGGVDTFLDLRVLAELDFEQRILGAHVPDGFIPGEGAAFVRLTAVRAAGRGQVVVLATGTARDPGHRYSEQPARGEGLAQALEKMVAGLRDPPGVIETTYASFNGENWCAKEWGVARLRHSERFSVTGQLEHPADCYGDTGAAAGALLLALAGRALAGGDRPGPALVFASSDREDRACALVNVLA
jgi:3-oxoacyl-[acyl-carrier-protein] synthase-1